MTSERRHDLDGTRAKARADALLSEEVAAGTDDAEAQAAAILQDSDVREGDESRLRGPAVEHRRSEDTVDDQPAPNP